MPRSSHAAALSERRLSLRKALVAAAAALTVMTVLGNLYQWLHATVGDARSVDVLQASVMPAGLSAWFVCSRRRGDTWTFRLLVGAAFFLLMWTASFLMTHGWPF